MRRKITAELEAWAARPNKKPLVLFGARQTGKTTSVLDFARTHGAYADVIHIDFYKQPGLKAAFAANLDPRSVIAALEALLGREIPSGNTLLFLDEIQDCDQAITALKFFATDAPEYPVIAAGSLLGVHVARSGSFPVGYVDMLTMHPMDFEEFCWALGEERAFALARASFHDLTECAVHDHLLGIYKEYLLVGGMPEAVAAYAESRSLPAARAVQSNIRTAYAADMVKYISGVDAAKVGACWDSLPAQLAKESGSTKFMWKYVASGAKAERYESAVDWLVAAGVATRCTQISDGLAPLKSFEKPTSFKLYMADTGLLANAYGASPADLETRDVRTGRFRGGVAENYVMQQLVSAGQRPYYWGVQSTGEVEFVLQTEEGVIPVEVKSGKHVASPSAIRFANKYGCPYLVRVSEKNFGSSDGVHSVPLYAACLLGESWAGTTAPPTGSRRAGRWA